VEAPVERGRPAPVTGASTATAGFVIMNVRHDPLFRLSTVVVAAMDNR
jgi:hypothetical protein